MSPKQPGCIRQARGPGPVCCPSKVGSRRLRHGLPSEDADLNAVVRRVPELANARDLTIEPLAGGLSNTNYLAAADGAQYVVRIAGAAGPVLGIDRSRERAAHARAEAAGIAPEMVAFLMPEGHSVKRYLADAKPVSEEQFRTPRMIERVAGRLRNVHELDLIHGGFDPYDDIRRWLEIVRGQDDPMPTRLPPLLDRVFAIETSRATSVAADPVLCHNDPYFTNFLDDGTLWLVDWEYAGMGDRLYDVAGVAHALDDDGRNTLLQAYFGSLDPAKRQELDDLVNVYLCWNVVWSLVQHTTGSVAFDYAEFAERLLDLVD